MATKEELEDQLAQTRSDMKVLASLASERATEVAIDAKDAAKEKVGALSAEAQAMLDEATVEAKRFAKDAEATMKANPLATVGIAFGIGMLLGSVMRR